MDILAFGEFIVSNNFFILLTRLWNLPNSLIELGAYQQGIPIRPIADFVWGSDSGLRTLPILSSLYAFQRLFPNNWDYIYFFITILLSFITFILALKLVKKINVFIILGAIFFCGNLWIIDRLYSGYWQLNIVYALLPFLITIPLKVADQKQFTWQNLSFWSVLYALFGSIIVLAQPHFLIMAGVFSFTDFIIKKRFFSYF
ncbi:MAG: hypothetical protein ACR2LN_06370 [Candidatus Levyibacteriota bacterium]